MPQRARKNSAIAYKKPAGPCKEPTMRQHVAMGLEDNLTNVLVLGLAGRSGSGKTTIAQYLVQKAGFRACSFGDVVRREANKRGLTTERRVLQDLGVLMIHEWGWEKFALETVGERTTNQPVVVDGVRHSAAVDALEGISISPFLLVFVDIAESTRRQRLVARGTPEAEIERANRHAVESEIDLLRARAGLTVDGGDNLTPPGIVDWITSSSGPFAPRQS